MKNRCVVVLASLDTKAEEADFVCQVVRDEGGEPLLVDTGVLGRPRTRADVSRHQVAEAAGTTIASVIAAKDQAQALVVMADGARHIVDELFEQGRLGGILSIGGSRGTALGTRVMQALPIGIPKLMLSTMATGQTPFGPYVGTRDVTMMPSVADVLGVNVVTRPILTNAAVAITAMARAGTPILPGTGQVFAATMLGATTPLVEEIRRRVSAGGRQLVAFHATGTGGRVMEELIDEGVVHGVFDVSLSEIVGWLAGGPFSAGAHRLEAAGRRGIPQVIVPGGIDFVIEGPPNSLPERYAGRHTLCHTPTITLVRTSADELRALARYIGERVADGAGPVAVVLPRSGFSRFSIAGEPLHEPETDRAFVEALVDALPARCHVVELEADVNDAQVAESAVQLMDEMLG
jgi:uncharacterized protein (UPF0261 family)